jgi:phage terminase large subunit GpA-like protein
VTTAEQRVPVHTVKGLEHRWQCPPGKRNEALDTTVYNFFLAEAIGMSSWTDRMWERLESGLQPDLFDRDARDEEDAAPEASATAQPQAPPLPTAPPAAAPPPAFYVPSPTSLASSDWSSRL